MYTKPEACLQFKSRIKGKEAKREAKYTLGKTTNSIELDPQFSLWVWTVGYFGNRNPKKKKKSSDRLVSSHLHPSPPQNLFTTCTQGTFYFIPIAGLMVVGLITSFFFSQIDIVGGGVCW